MTSEDYKIKILEEYKNGLATEEEMSSLLMIFAMQYHKEQLPIPAVVGQSEKLHHKAKVLTKKQVETNRSNAYKYLDL